MNDKHEQSDELGFHQELKKQFMEGPSYADCIEKTSKFEEVYLANVKDLKDYYWDKETFTATVEISENKKLNISLVPSGLKCDSIRKSVTFVVPKDFLYNENKNEIIDDFLWISKLICNKEEFITIKEILDKKKDSDILNFQDDSFVVLFPKIEKKETDFIKNDDLKPFMAYFQKDLEISSYTLLYFFQ